MQKFKQTATVSVLLFSAFILTVFSERASDYAYESLKVCATCVIPSLFPYMVVSQLIVSSSASRFLGRIFPISRITGLTKNASSVILIGAVCGFPVGAKSACDMYKRGELTKVQAEVLISWANNTGPSFVVSVIGASFFNSYIFGWQLYAFQLLSSLICAFWVNRIVFPYKRTIQTTKAIPTKSSDMNFFTSVFESTNAIITVCGFIVFFSVILGFIKPFINEISDSMGGIFASLLEFTAGSKNASAIGGAEGRFLAGLAVGWSGLSVFCQTASFTSQYGLSLKRCIAVKSLQGILCGTLCAFLGTAANTTATFTEIETAFLIYSHIPTSAICFVLFTFLIKNLTKNAKIEKVP